MTLALAIYFLLYFAGVAVLTYFSSREKPLFVYRGGPATIVDKAIASNGLVALIAVVVLSIIPGSRYGLYPSPSEIVSVAILIGDYVFLSRRSAPNKVTLELSDKINLKDDGIVIEKTGSAEKKETTKVPEEK
ncbi:MAG: hypothetical protein QXV17_14935 [Candidatus Micrarchaeaceae archaeon]